MERRSQLGGAWHDRWDSFTLVAPNYTLRLPGMHYAGEDPDGFMRREQVLRYVQDYGAFTGAPVRLGTATRPLGVLFVNHTRRHRFTRPELAFVETLTSYLSVTI